MAGGRDRLRSAIERRIESSGEACAPLQPSRARRPDRPCPSATRRDRGSARARGPAPGGRGCTEAADQVEHLRRQVIALSPQSTLDRGYAVVQHRDGRIVMDREDVGVGELLRVRVARGDFGVRPVGNGTEDAPSPPPRQARKRARRSRSRRHRVSAMASGTGEDPRRRFPTSQTCATRRPAKSSSPSWPVEAGQAPLEDSMSLWRRGEALAAHCSRWLDGAQAEIERATEASASPSQSAPAEGHETA